MKKIAIISRAEALRIAKATPKSIIIKYDNGKYNWKGSSKPYIGTEHEVHDNVLALWVESRKDSEGRYAQVMCVTTRN